MVGKPLPLLTILPGLLFIHARKSSWSAQERDGQYTHQVRRPVLSEMPQAISKPIGLTLIKELYRKPMNNNIYSQISLLRA